MCERLEAVKQLGQRARELTAACTCARLANQYDATVAEPIPADMLKLLDQLPLSPFRRARG